jgi:hypothetical protein
MTASQRARLRLDALGKRPPWWRPLARRVWRARARAIVDAFAAELAAETMQGFATLMRAALERDAERVVN